MGIDFGEFTEAAYERLLDQLLARYRFEPFGTRSPERHVLWRHDVDFSVHRALALAHVEADKGVTATYFVLLHSPYYNALERAIVDRVKAIAGLGHRIGLHYEAAFYEGLPGGLEERLAAERKLLEGLIETPIEVFSFHNPELDGSLEITQDSLAEMTNVYSQTIRDTYRYVSDSNGFWRVTHLPTLLREPDAGNLHVLTHPEWWTPERLSPRARIARVIEGRAASSHAYYDEIIARSGRPNVR